MSLLSRLLGPSPAVRRAARQHLALTHPAWRFGGCSIRAVEPDRTVLAVFYSDPKLLQKPSPYLLYAIGRGGVIEELDCSPHSPYWIRGRK